MVLSCTGRVPELPWCVSVPKVSPPCQTWKQLSWEKHWFKMQCQWKLFPSF